MPSLSDLLNMGKRYVKDAMPGGLLNPEVNRQGILDGAALSTTAVPVLGDLLGLGADLNRYATDPESRTAGNFALSGLGMLPFVPAMTAWHGSPHKFDKFDASLFGSNTDSGMLGKAAYLSTDKTVANKFPNQMQFDADIKAPLNISMPDWKTDKKRLVTEALGIPFSATSEQITAAAKAKGFDSIVLDYSPAGYGHKELAVFDPEIIKRISD